MEAAELPTEVAKLGQDGLAKVGLGSEAAGPSPTWAMPAHRAMAQRRFALAMAPFRAFANSESVNSFWLDAPKARLASQKVQKNLKLSIFPKEKHTYTRDFRNINRFYK